MLWSTMQEFAFAGNSNGRLGVKLKIKLTLMFWAHWESPRPFCNFSNLPTMVSIKDKGVTDLETCMDYFWTSRKKLVKIWIFPHICLLCRSCHLDMLNVEIGVVVFFNWSCEIHFGASLQAQQFVILFDMAENKKANKDSKLETNFNIRQPVKITWFTHKMTYCWEKSSNLSKNFWAKFTGFSVLMIKLFVQVKN